VSQCSPIAELDRCEVGDTCVEYEAARISPRLPQALRLQHFTSSLPFHLVSPTTEWIAATSQRQLRRLLVVYEYTTCIRNEFTTRDAELFQPEQLDLTRLTSAAFLRPHFLRFGRVSARSALTLQCRKHRPQGGFRRSIHARSPSARIHLQPLS
jgi:hypothetical protein